MSVICMQTWILYVMRVHFDLWNIMADIILIENVQLLICDVESHQSKSQGVGFAPKF